MTTDVPAGKGRLGAEFWAMLGVGVALAMLLYHFVGGLRGEVAAINERLIVLEKGQARIEGWIQGRFREGETSE